MIAPRKTVHVPLGERSYDIQIGSGLLADIGARARDARLGSRVLIVADTNTDPLYGDTVEAGFRAAGLEPNRCVVPAGEASKSSTVLARCWSEAVKGGLDRHSAVVALGGGVVGDLAGFLAASLFRGVDFLQIPTTLLAMVDSAVGGKTGINLPEGKNLVGAFHQPNLVVCDLDVLSTLPEREFRAGMAEVIKYGCIADARFFGWLEDNLRALNVLDTDALAHVVGRSCEIKAEVVSEDETEQGRRAILNYGHTLGHAIEQTAGYGAWLHGEAISAGMVYASCLSEKINGLPEEVSRRTRELFRAFSLPISWQEFDWQTVLNTMRVDKKAVSSIPRFVLLEALGKAGLPVKIGEEDLKSVFEAGKPGAF